MKRLRALFSFEGRLDRLGYWRAQLLLGSLAAVIWALMLFAALASPFGPVLAVLFAPVVIGGLAVCVRRLHDRGKGARWLAFFWCAPLLCLTASELLAEWGEANSVVILTLALLGIGLLIWALVETGFLAGSPGFNRFGPPPVRRRPGPAREPDVGRGVANA